MTLYVLFDEVAAGRVSLDDEVPVSEAWATGGSKMYILWVPKWLLDLVKGLPPCRATTLVWPWQNTYQAA